MQSVSNQFATSSLAPIRSPKIQAQFSWTKKISGGAFTIGISKIAGTDRLAGIGFVPEEFNLYIFEDDTNYLVSAQIDRSYAQPFSIAKAASDIVFDDTSGYFDPNGGSAIAGLVQTGKPILVKLGFNNELINIFAGVVSSYPTFNFLAKTVDIFGTDLLDIVSNLTMPDSVTYTNKTVGQIIYDIFVNHLGITDITADPSGTAIPSVVLTEGDNVGQILLNLVQTDGGKLWCREYGDFWYTSRNTAPYTHSFVTLTNDLVMNVTDLITNYIINSCTITGTGGITSTFTDNDSIQTFGVQQLTINNNYFQTQTMADTMAQFYVEANNSNEAFHVLTIRAIPQLQLGDFITWNNFTYSIVRNKLTYSASTGLTQELTIKRYTQGRLFTINISAIGGSDQIAL